MCERLCECHIEKMERTEHTKGMHPGRNLSVFLLSALSMPGESLCSHFISLVKLFSRQNYKPQALARHGPCSVGGTQMGFNLLPVIFVCLFVCAGALKAKQIPETKRGGGGGRGEREEENKLYIKGISY